MYDRHTLTISSEDLEPTTFDSLRKASKATGFLYMQRTTKELSLSQMKKFII